MTENDFDWVTKRLNCTAGIAFAQLRAGAESNVTARNESASNGDRFKAAMNTTSNGTAFSVVRGRVREHGYAEVKFTISRHNTGNEQIVIDGIDISLSINRRNQIVVQPQLNDEGECVLTIDGVETPIWRILYLALERIFFQPDAADTSGTIEFTGF